MYPFGTAILLMTFLPLAAACLGERQVGDAAEPSVCLEGTPFVADGNLALPTTGAADADLVSGLRWSRHPGCERLVIDLAGVDGTPASAAGNVTATLLRELGVVRISLGSVERVDPEATEAMFDGSLARAAYAFVSGEGGGIHIDLHLGEPAEAHAAILADPARVVVDLRPGGEGIPEPAAANRWVVVLEPRPGPAAYPLTVTGYARTFEANVVARIEQGGERIDETFTTSAGWLDAWGYYSITIAEGPAGRIELHVGEYSARDGTWQGVVVALDQQ